MGKVKNYFIIYLIAALLVFVIVPLAQAVDSDGDGILDANDNCWEVINPDQTDSDLDCPAEPFMTDPVCGNACDDFCPYELVADINYDCKTDLLDFAIMSRYWLIDCLTDANDPACISFDADNDGWNSLEDCDDNDPLEFPGQSWYADCDGDGYERSTAVIACDAAGADAMTPCSDSMPPDGGWSNIAGIDCDDEDSGEFPGQNWYADCDGDSYERSAAVVSCDAPATPCADAMPPDGGWSNIAGINDCDDEDVQEFPGQSWYADCDGDGYERSAPVIACDVAGADAMTPCSDSMPPDGGWSNIEGTDCDDEDAGEFPGNGC